MFELPDWFVALMIATLAVCGAVPASGPLAVVGYLRGGRHRLLNGFWYWAWSTALSTAIMAACAYLDIFWCAAVLDWTLLWLLAWFLMPRAQRDRILHRRTFQPTPYVVPQPMPQPMPMQQPLHAQQYAGWPR
ncbi:hypothetical protein OHB24_06870 [Kribbella sp. NBC_00482]|uniref:hypothetical protein n=1 Tax=Kribbella sp. NBC_00482 TaxID=2975968 RepID=UPI002E18005F